MDEVAQAATAAGPEWVLQAGFQMLERAAFALVVDAPASGQLDRLLSLVRASGLSDGRKSAIESDLISRSTVCSSIDSAFEEAFPEATGREPVLDLVNEVWQQMIDGVTVGEPGGSMGQRAEVLVARLADDRATPARVAAVGTQDLGSRLVSFCSAIAAVALFEEPEESFGLSPQIGGDEDPEED